jgi:hypothetical protein
MLERAYALAEGRAELLRLPLVELRPGRVVFGELDGLAVHLDPLQAYGL